MVKIEAVIQPVRLDDVKIALENLGIDGITISEVLEHGGPIFEKTFYRGVEYRVDTVRVKLEMLVSSYRADEVVNALSQAARTRLSCDDGRILVYDVADAIRIRNGTRLQFTVT